MATPPAGTKLSLGKLGRATAVDNANYISRTSLNDCARDSGTATTNLSNFYVGAVDDALDGYPYVDEQTNETYEVTFTNANSLFDSRIKTRAGNFSWTTSNSDLFALQSSATRTAQYNAAALADTSTYTSKSFEANLVTDSDFNNWASSNLLGDWTESGGTVISRKDITGFSTRPSGSNNYMVQFDTLNGYIEQSFTVKGNSTYQIKAIATSSDAGQGTIDMYVSGAYTQLTWNGITGPAGTYHQTRDDFYTSGSVGVTQNLKIRFTAVSASVKPLLDYVTFERWEGAHFTDTDVTITGKYHDDGQSDGFNDHATRYNTAISKTIEIQDTYGGLAIACFLPGTLILMSDGTTKKIEDINVGDEVRSLDLPGLPDEDLGYTEWKSYTMRPMDEEDLENLMAKNKKSAFVENLFYDYMSGYYSINNGFLKVTAEHDLFTYSNGKWRWNTASELQKGMKLFGYNGEVVNIDTIKRVNGEVEVINFDVEPLDVYYAGGMLVHNKGVDSEP